MKVAKLYLHEVEEFEGVSGGTNCHQVGYELSFTFTKCWLLELRQEITENRLELLTVNKTDSLGQLLLSLVEFNI